MYSRHQSALGLIHLHSLEGSKFVLHYYSLGGDTAMLAGLYAGLCHTFLLIILMAFYRMNTGIISQFANILYMHLFKYLLYNNVTGCYKGQMPSCQLQVLTH